MEIGAVVQARQGNLLCGWDYLNVHEIGATKIALNDSDPNPK